MDDLQYISRDGEKWRVRVPSPEGGRRHVGMFDTVEAAVSARDEALYPPSERWQDAALRADDGIAHEDVAHLSSVGMRGAEAGRAYRTALEALHDHGIKSMDVNSDALRHGGYEAKDFAESIANAFMQSQRAFSQLGNAMAIGVSGATLDDDDTDVDALWQAAFQAQAAVQQQQAKKRNNSVALPHEPVAIAFLSDLHFGSAGTDYRAAKQDAETIRDTPGMYAAFHGDMIDNWIIGKLTGLQRYQAMNGDAEMRLFASWLEILREKLLVVVSGNHDLWSHKLAGIDIVAQHLKGVRCLYDKHQVILNLDHGTTRRKVVIRHKWRFNSVYNPTHGLEVGWDRGDVDYDWAVGGHTHIGTYFRDFHRHGKRRTAILTGAYKRVDGFADEIGFASCKDNGCGAKVLHPDGREWAFNNLQEAASFVGYLRGE